MFTSRSDLFPLPNGKDWLLKDRPTTWVGDDFEVTSSVGTTTDFSSIPKLMRWYAAPATGKHRWAAVPHDKGYRDNPLNWPRKKWDELYRDIARSEGTRPAKAKVLYTGLRLFGWAAWNKHRSNDGN